MDIGRLLKVMIPSLISLLVLAGCNSASDNESDDIDLDGAFVIVSPPPIVFPPPVDPTVLKTGFFLDSAVSGLNYVRSDGISGTTGIDGDFEYYPGDTIDFRLGHVSLGTTSTPIGALIFPSDFQTTPLSLTPAAASADQPEVLNKLILLQTLDSDGDLDNGIQISAAVHAAIAGKLIDFAIPTDQFINGDFAVLLNELNADGVFTADSPRSIQNKIDALRHFGNLNPGGLNFEWPTVTYTNWWREQNDCTGYGKTTLTRKGASVNLCPHINGFDGCYDGVILGNGDVLLPEVLSNSICEDFARMNPGLVVPSCEGYRQETLVADLKFLDNGITGQYQASCESTVADQVQTVDADFAATGQTGGSFIPISPLYGVQRELFEQIQGHTQNGSCSVNNDCATLRLQGRYNCSLPRDLPYSAIDADLDWLNFKEWVYEDVTTELESSQNQGGSTICTIRRVPTASCQANVCAFVE